MSCSSTIRPRDRISSQGDAIDPLEIEKRPDILDESPGVVSRCRFGRFGLAAPRQTNDVEAVRELRREVVELVRRLAEGRQEEQRLAAAAPIQVVKPDAIDRGEVVRPARLRADHYYRDPGHQRGKR